MLAQLTSCTFVGVRGLLIDVEVDLALGLPTFQTVGLPDNAVRESKDRVKAAIKNCGFEFPNRRITVNLAPADLKKEGAGLDLPMALGIIAAGGHLSQEQIKGYCTVGELSLNGSLRRVAGILPIILAAQEAGLRGVLLPAENSEEASIVAAGIPVFPLHSLLEAIEFLRGEKKITPLTAQDLASLSATREYPCDFAEVKGQQHVKRALEIAASGGHNLLLQGPPGTGKTMLARRLCTIMPDMNLEEIIATTRVYSVSGLPGEGQGVQLIRPFRAPHHTISDAGLIGGGMVPRPGEVSLAHNGVLFLDELPEFKRRVLEVLRQPLEDGQVTIARANMKLTFPARFLLVAALNPCPCGYLGDPQRECRCNASQIYQYRSRLSGPLLDRIDLHLEVATVQYQEMSSQHPIERSITIRQRVNQCRKLQASRFAGHPAILCNAHMGTEEIETFCPLTSGTMQLLRRGVEKLGLSARGYHRIIKVARTIADMAGSENIETAHAAEAMQYRRLNIM